MKKKNLLFISGLAVLSSVVIACGPNLTSAFLSLARSLLEGPEAWKRFGLEDVRHAPPAPKALEPVVKATNQWEKPLPSTLEVDVAEFERVMKEKNLPDQTLKELVSNYQQIRLSQLSRWEDAEMLSLPKDNKLTPLATADLPWIKNNGWPENIPAEFKLYVEGVARFHDDGAKGAREVWMELLRLPQEQRLNRSTWAAWMLYKTAPSDEDARHWLEEVCRLIEKEKCADSLRMQPAALALLELKASTPSPASLALHFHNAKANPRSVYFAALLDEARSIAGSPDAAIRADAAQDAAAREIITAVLTQDAGIGGSSDRSKEVYKKRLTDWCAELALAKVEDDAVMSAAGIALYRAGNYEMARKFLAIGAKTWETLWVQGKLELQRGKPELAAAKYSEALRLFPKEESSTITSVTESEWDHSDSVEPPESGWLHGVQNSRFLAECGTVRLSRSDFAGALKLFLDAKCPHDAAYIVEHVMTADEVLDFVKKYQLKTVPEKPVENQEGRINWWAGGFSTLVINEPMNSFLYVVARRLAREAYFTPAREFYPPELIPFFERYVSLYRRVQSRAVSQELRARCLMEAARYHRWYGMELFGSEGDPDAAIWDGSFEADDMQLIRCYNFKGKEGSWNWGESGKKIWNEAVPTEPIPLRPSALEITRLKQNMLWGRPRFHYREVAAKMAREASHMLPSNSEEAAMMLAEGGCWLTPNEGGVDPMFEELISRFSKTKFAQEADTRRWYPDEFREKVREWNPEQALCEPIPGDLAKNSQ